MNFFGHAAVASWNGGPGVVLGAMLPDFAMMCGGRLAEPSDAEIARGIALHHATDAAFHRSPPVVALMRELGDRLDRAGCARGPRRAAAHIGVELLLDGVLVDNAEYRAAYVAGLAYPTQVGTEGIRWRELTDTDRFAALIARVRAHGVPDDLRRPEAIVVRLHRMLAHRPLLAPSAHDLAAIKAALVEYQPRVVVAADTVMRALGPSLRP